MITFIHAWWLRLRRKLSRSEWAIKLLRLSRSSDQPDAPGLIICQIDGLARRQFEAALATKRMPFLQMLLDRENYQLRSFYSGLPSTTSAVQGELFYGKKTAVPAYSFVSRTLQQIMVMIHSDAMAAVDSRLMRHGKGLLEDGAMYCCVYSGGACESHLTPTSIGWDGGFRHGNFFATLAVAVLHLYSLLRIMLLLLLELALAGIDCIRGLISGKNWRQELLFIPHRIGVTIALREMIVIGVKIDAARGVPIIYANFLGYDEQSHRRGPASRFAHWTLKGIDDSLQRIWNDAHHSGHRRYEMWILSDHGQESVRTYNENVGCQAQTMVREVLRRQNLTPLQLPTAVSHQYFLTRVGIAGKRLLQYLLPWRKPDDMDAAWRAMGPVAHLYVQESLSAAQRQAVADDLHKSAAMPLLLWRGDHQQVMARTAAGTFLLPEQIRSIVGQQHPFAQQIALDLIGLVNHPDAGVIIAMGWADGQTPISFARENGAHGGIGGAETQGFILTPEYAPLPDQPWVRPRQVRLAAMQEISRQSTHAQRRASWSQKQQRRDFLRVMTYNVHRCVGMDGKLSLDRIAHVIAAWNPDLVALQELDVRRSRSNHVDQAHAIATELQMDFHFHPALTVADEQYGDALLCRYPMRMHRAGALPGIDQRPRLEPRGALWCRLEFNGRQIDVVNTHLGLRRAERRAQIDALLGQQWLAQRDDSIPLLFCGDLNAWPGSYVCRRLREYAIDVQEAEGANKPLSTFFGHLPLWRIDYIFFSPHWTVNHVNVPRTRLTRIASDHLPVIADLRLRDSA